MRIFGHHIFVVTGHADDAVYIVVEIEDLGLWVPGIICTGNSQLVGIFDKSKAMFTF